MRFGVIVFPGTWSDRDFEHALGAVLGHEVERVWHEDTDLSSYDCMVAPGGFSYGDYLRRRRHRPHTPPCSPPLWARWSATRPTASR